MSCEKTSLSTLATAATPTMADERLACLASPDPTARAAGRRAANEILRSTILPNKRYGERPGSNLFSSVRDLIDAGSMPREWVVDGFIPGQSVVGLVGRSGSFKSFAAIGMGLSVAAGVAWAGTFNVTQGGVCYCAGEGASGLLNRMLAWAAYENQDLGPLPFYVASRVPAIGERTDRRDLTALMDGIDSIQDQDGAPVRLLVFDTLARGMAGLDENSAKDMGAFMSPFDDIRARFPATSVLILHHTGHEGGKPRGSTAFTASLDAEYLIEHSHDLVTVRCKKARDWERPPPTIFAIRTVSFFKEGSESLESSLTLTDPQRLEDSASAPRGRKRITKEMRCEARRLRDLGHPYKDITAETGISGASLTRAFRASITPHKGEVK